MAVVVLCHISLDRFVHPPSWQVSPSTALQGMIPSIELLNQSDFIELNGFKMDRLKLFFPVRQSDDECGKRRKMETSAAAVAGGWLVV